MIFTVKLDGELLDLRYYREPGGAGIPFGGEPAMHRIYAAKQGRRAHLTGTTSNRFYAVVADGEGQLAPRLYAVNVEARDGRPWIFATKSAADALVSSVQRGDGVAVKRIAALALPLPASLPLEPRPIAAWDDWYAAHRYP